MSLFKSAVKFFSLSIFTLLLAACASTKKDESTGQIIDSTAVTAKVKAAFLNDQLVKARSITVITHKGVVQLSGFVASHAESNRAANLARGIEGVRAVENDLIVK